MKGQKVLRGGLPAVTLDGLLGEGDSETETEGKEGEEREKERELGVQEGEKEGQLEPLLRCPCRRPRAV